MFENSNHSESTPRSESLHEMKTRLEFMKDSLRTAQRTSDSETIADLSTEIELLEEQIAKRSARKITTRYAETPAKDEPVTKLQSSKRMQTELEKIRKALKE